ncbi:hypothetical protein HYV84_01610 [Candidatus Woesearchaeota archaeon]|nr:hypothetical protein [Candidatus Woesearchaeota archaeon]
MQKTLVLRDLVRTHPVLHKGLISRNAKVILYDIFTFSCMNCQRFWMFLKRLHTAYRKYGLELVIIHPYEWMFEKDARNVKRALKGLNITNPVILDPQRKLIKELGINFWPAQILVKDGKIIYKHIGEGNYKQLELKIKRTLNIYKKRVKAPDRTALNSHKNKVIQSSLKKDLGILRAGKKSIFPTEPTYSKIPAVYCGKSKNKKVFCNDGLPKEFGVLHTSGACRQTDECIISDGPNSCISLKTKGNKVNVIAQAIGKKKSLLLARWSRGRKPREAKLRISTPKLYSIPNASLKNGTLAIFAIRGKTAIYSFAFE